MYTEKTVWECNFCKKLLKSKKGIEKHVVSCYHNPDMKACASCNHFKANLGQLLIEDFVEMGYVKFKNQLEEDFYFHDKLCFHSDKFSDKIKRPQNGCSHWELSFMLKKPEKLDLGDTIK